VRPIPHGGGDRFGGRADVRPERPRAARSRGGLRGPRREESVRVRQRRELRVRGERRRRRKRRKNGFEKGRRVSRRLGVSRRPRAIRGPRHAPGLRRAPLRVFRRRGEVQHRGRHRRRGTF
jgi:hypothetical protein